MHILLKIQYGLREFRLIYNATGKIYTNALDLLGKDKENEKERNEKFFRDIDILVIIGGTIIIGFLFVSFYYGIKIYNP